MNRISTSNLCIDISFRSDRTTDKEISGCLTRKKKICTQNIRENKKKLKEPKTSSKIPKVEMIIIMNTHNTYLPNKT
jgi:hypothetical protein